MAEKTKSEKLEREYIIPIREKTRTVPRYKKTNKAVRTIKEFLVKHMKVRDRDLNKIKIDKYLNEALWHRGIRNPPHKIKVRAVKEDGIVRVELAEPPASLKFKKLREEKMNKSAKEAVSKKKTLMEKAKEAMKPGEKAVVEEQPTEKAEENKEKEKTSAIATQQMEKETAKYAKHETKRNPSESKHQRRMALQK